MWGDKICRLEIRLTQEQSKLLCIRSRAAGMSKADIIRALIDEYLRESPPNSGQKNNEGVGVEADDTPVKQNDPL